MTTLTETVYLPSNGFDAGGFDADSRWDLPTWFVKFQAALEAYEEETGFSVDEFIEDHQLPLKQVASSVGSAGKNGPELEVVVFEWESAAQKTMFMLKFA